MRQIVPAGPWFANLEATRQALAPVAAKRGRYFGLSRKDRSPRAALSSGLTSLIARSRSAPLATSALAASATAPKVKGPARSKKPGCSIKISEPSAAAWAMTRSHKRKSLPLEVRRSAEAEDLSLVEVGLKQGFGDVGAERAKWRLPNDAESRRHADLRAVENEASLLGNGVQGKITWVEERAGVDENSALHAEIVGDEGERETQLGRGRPVDLAAE